MAELVPPNLDPAEVQVLVVTAQVERMNVVRIVWRGCIAIAGEGIAIFDVFFEAERRHLVTAAVVPVAQPGRERALMRPAVLRPEIVMAGRLRGAG